MSNQKDNKANETEVIVDKAFIEANPEFVKEQKLKIGDKFSYPTEDLAEQPDNPTADQGEDPQVNADKPVKNTKKAKKAKWPVSQPK